MFKKLFGKKPALADTPTDPIEEAKQNFDALKAARGMDDPDTLQALFAFGQALNGRRRFDEAHTAGQELLSAFEAQSGPDHPNVGYALDVMATALSGQGDHTGALAIRQRSVDLLEGHFGPEHEMTLQRARLLAVDFVETGQVSKARETLGRCMSAATEIPPLYADFLDTSAFVTQAADGPEAAIPILEDLVSFLRDNGQEQTPKFASKLFNLSQMLLQAGRKLDALNASSEAGMVALQTYGPDHPAAQEIFAFQTHLRQEKESGAF